MAIRGRHGASKWLKMAINGPFVAISRSGGSKMVDQCGSRLDQGRTFIGFETSTWMISDTFLIVYGTVHLIISKQLELSSIYGLLFSFQ